MKFRSVRKLIKRILKRWSLNKRFTSILIVLFIISLSILYGVLFLKLNKDLQMYNFIPSTIYKCHSIDSDLFELNNFIIKNNLNLNRKIKKLDLVPLVSHSNNKVDSTILIFVEAQHSKSSRSLIEFLQTTKFRYEIEFDVFKSIPTLYFQNNAKYSLIIFENYDHYLQLSKPNLNLLNQYCIKNNVGLIGFLNGKEDKSKKVRQLKRSSLFVKSNVQIKNYHLNKNSKIFRIAKAGSVCQVTKKNWTIFLFNQTNYRPIGLAYQSNNLVTTVVQDLGKLDGIQRILFGYDITFWLHKLLLLDSISYLTNLGQSLPLQRILQIDIDDIFVGEKGTRLKVSDVESLIEAQKRIGTFVENFKFNLGFSGKHLHKGNEDEDLGDDHLIKNAENFRWFCHTWAHSQPHLYQNTSFLETQLQLNKEFAKEHGIHIDTTYSVAPHHSGVYPVHEPLYDAWKKIYDIKVTSTEQYPHMRPAILRRGFIYKGIQVLPRRTCGLYTHTIFMDRYPGGKRKLDDSIFGGELFQTFLFNPINIFMTHMSNYANDRIALHTFESVLSFIRCWTNLKFITIQPTDLAKKYFDLYPEEKLPIWQSPCKDKRHLSIWSSNKTCKKLPDFLIIGPQKTGTTALHTFLTIHPFVQSSYPTKEYFEELQFFNGPNYLKGLDWYLNQFPSRSNKSMKLFEKSANYFDSEKVPQRVHALLPNVKLIIILINPIKRAYSWYQHARFHNDNVALNYSFYEVITTTQTSLSEIANQDVALAKKLKTLRNRILNPGCYSTHLEHWLQYFDKDQLIILDGDELKTNPATVMSQLQLRLALRPIIDYKQHLEYVPKKRFFCPIINENGSKNISLQSQASSSELDDLNTNQFVSSGNQINLIDVLNGSYVGYTKLNGLMNHTSLYNDSGQTAAYNTNNTIQTGTHSNGAQVKCLGKSKGRVYREIHLRSIKFLHKYYMKCNTLLFKLLVRLKVKIPFWLQEELNNE